MGVCQRNAGRNLDDSVDIENLPFLKAAFKMGCSYVSTGFLEVFAIKKTLGKGYFASKSATKICFLLFGLDVPPLTWALVIFFGVSPSPIETICFMFLKVDQPKSSDMMYQAPSCWANRLTKSYNQNDFSFKFRVSIVTSTSTTNIYKYIIKYLNIFSINTYIYIYTHLKTK